MDEIPKKVSLYDIFGLEKSLNNKKIESKEAKVGDYLNQVGRFD